MESTTDCDIEIDAMMARGLFIDTSFSELENLNSATPNDDDDDDQVRVLAAKLAPQVRELESLLASPSGDFSPTSTPTSHLTSSQYYNDDSYQDDDDSMDQEMERLSASEQLLRQELEFAHDFGEMLQLSVASPEKIVVGGDFREPENREHDGASTQLKSSPPYQTFQNPLPKAPYTMYDHSHTLGLLKEPRGGWYVLPQKDDGSIRDYVIPVPEKELLRLYVGLLNADDYAAGESPKSISAFDTLPVRIVAMKLRPDVLVGAIMEGVAAACNCHGEIERRQGGHITCTFEQNLRVDLQVCTFKGSGGRFCERTLLMRFYSLGTLQSPRNDQSDDATEKDTTKLEANLLLMEAAALVQKLETRSRDSLFGNSFFSPSKHTYKDKSSMRATARSQLLQNYKSCPSVRSGNLTLPALSQEDWPRLCHSWRLVEYIWEELDTRDLSFSSLMTAPFGKFPSLPTLDVHFCSQLRRVCRENMIISLLKSASELEEYAREAEYACANLIQVLKPTFEIYQLTAPALPQALPLTAYPLDFTPHQATCPPWGIRVMESLNKISIMDHSPNHSFDRAEKAVQMVLDAFQLQDDEEQSARLGRKNVQVMDRLAKMQAHKRDSIDKISQSYFKSSKSRKAADEYHSFAQKGNSNTAAEEQVPLFKCSILVGTATTGTCYVTASQIMCVTQLIPIVGGNTISLLDLDGLEFVVHEGSSSLLNPLPAGISIRQGGDEVYSFRPSYGAARLKSFLEIVQAGGGPHPLKFTDRGGLLYMYGDSPPPRRPRSR
jgi:hypothetical protein